MGQHRQRRIWRYLHFLPDRGFNNGSTFSNYAARINQFSFAFKPYTSSTATTQQNQIIFTGNLGSTLFTYDHDNDAATAPVPTTGLLATSSLPLFGVTTPASGTPTTIASVTLNNRLTLDSEGLAFDPRAGRAGSGWIGDEYGAYVYHFDANKQIDGAVALPAALVPHAPAGTINFAQDPPANGRRINQGMEGIAVNQDGTRLFALLQSATIQDSGSGNQGRTNSRLLVYDISSSDSPGQPIAQYVIQLPRIDDTGSTNNGETVNRAGAQSSIVVLNDHQLLVLSRDGNGRGATGSPVFKSVLLADLANATNIDRSFDGEGASVAPAGQLQAAVTPIAWTEALNLLGKLDLSFAELEKFGLNLSTAPGDLNTLSEKWEAMSLVSVGDPATPNDYFLFIGNDNDFMTASGKLLDADGTLENYNAGLENDTFVLAYRVQIVPEPSTMAFLALTGSGLAIVVLRRQQLHRS
ncbi:MAG TPA: esterase-like activity of phytase family protein [Terrimicrobiaceae bacterium]